MKAPAMKFGRPGQAPAPASPSAPPAESAPAIGFGGKQRRQPSREGKKAMQAWVSPEVWRQLSILAVRLDRTKEDLLLEGLDLLFEAHGLHRIAKDEKGRG